MLVSTVVLSLVAAGAHALDAPTVASVEPAATTVAPTDTDARVNLFAFETVQLTDEVVANLESNAEVAEFAHLFSFADASGSSSKQRRAGSCKSAPGDLLWPSSLAWGVFDLLLGGALSPIIPIASPCYKNSKYNDYDVAKCADVNTRWTTESLHYSDPGSVMFPMYQGKTCMPGTDASALSNCTQGGYSAYSIKVSNVAQIQLAVNFARLSNLRLVIKNTGHDYNGRSTGKNALSLWTHNLKDINFLKNYESPDYKGPAFKLGAGVQVHELYEAADKNGVTAVGGICPTVGVTGGYITGGGHSPVMQLFGLGADQVVALEIVTASGRFLTATPSVNSDLYWAMLGGGGGTFGIVTSAVVKAHPKIHVTTSTFSFNSFAVGQDTFWQGFSAFWDSFPEWNAARTYSWWGMFNVGGGNMVFTMDPFFATNKTIAEYDALVAPFFAKLTALNIPYTVERKFHDNFLSAYDATFNGQDQNIGAAFNIAGNRILPAVNWANATIRADTVAALRKSAATAIGIMGYHQANANPSKVLNSANPHLRSEASQLIVIGPAATSDEGLGEIGRQYTNDVMGPIREVSPAGGAYGNEAEVNEPNWQQAFWGSNYARLVSLKKKWDPTGLFYVHHGVGSEEWTVKGGVKWGGIQTQDGQLCRV